jgi:hypothetical protein
MPKRARPNRAKAHVIRGTSSEPWNREYVSPGATIENMVIFAKVKGYLHMTQGLLPPALIDTGKVHLAQCAERRTEANKMIGKMGAADWGFVEFVPGYGMGAYNEEKR